MPDLAIRGGTVVFPAGLRRADIAIDAGVITEIGEGVSSALEEIDARGLTVFPAVVDCHVHFNEPGRADWEGAASGSRALAAGGGATFIDMPLNSTPCTLSAADFEAKRRALERASIADFALWGGLVPGRVDALAELAECGAIGFKAFLSNSGLPEFPRADDLTLYEGMREAARLNLPVSVHAESEEITAGLSRRAIESGRTSIRDYLDSRPVLAEVEAIQRAGLIAAETGARLHIVHVSSGRGVAAALEARARGADISIETCAHYLFFTEDDVERLGAVAKCAPPLRSAAERESLWKHLLEGHVDVVASDHSPALPSMKEGADFFAIWGGIAGVQSTLAVLLERGHFARDLPLRRVAGLTAESPARRFGLARKGAIAPGMDADFALVDLTACDTLKRGGLFQRHAFSPYVGETFRGRICRTIRRGETIFQDGKIAARSCGRLPRPGKLEHASLRTNS
jgi:allantoinase